MEELSRELKVVDDKVEKFRATFEKFVVRRRKNSKRIERFAFSERQTKLND